MVRLLVPRLPALPVCFAFVVQLLSPCSAEFAVVGPLEPILAKVGEDAELPCHLSTKMSAETLQLMWVRPSHRQVVYRYAHGQEDVLAEEFQGRTSISREDITVGKAALWIRDVQASDNGTYLCYFQDGDFYAKAQVELQVAVLGSDPHTEMKSYEAGGIRLECTSAGWYPPPQIEWRDAGGQSLPAEAVDEPADPRGLYAVSSSVILEGSPGEVSCVIRNPLLGQEKSARLSIPGSFFRDSLPRVVFLPLALLLVSIAVLLLCLLRRRPKWIRALSQDEEEERELRMQRPEQSCSGSEVPQTLQDKLRVDKDLALTTIYFEFGQEVPKSSWRMFMRLAGLEENDIAVCEHGNLGNLLEQHPRMLLRWQSTLGRAASPFRLMAALCKMRLRESLENVINKLVAEDILGSKDAEPPN